MQTRPRQDPVVITDQRPWGSFERFTLNEPSTVKLIYVRPGDRLSLQRHEHRDELWVALDPAPSSRWWAGGSSLKWATGC